MPAGMVTGLRDVDLGVPDVAAHARFYTDVWRLTAVAERAGSIYLRGSGAWHHILALHPRNVVIEYTAEIEQVGAGYRVREPREWAYPPGHSDLWGATPPPSDRMQAARKRIRFARDLFRPIK